jgi:hypothetical protein
MSTVTQKTHATDTAEAVLVIPLDGSRAVDASWELRVPPLNAADKAIKFLQEQRELGRVDLDDDAIKQLCQSAVLPSELAGAPLLKHRTESGWLWTLETRIFTSLANVAYANDRMLGDATYDADPTSAAASNPQISMPTSAGTESSLRYHEKNVALLSAADRNFQGVLSDNPQDVGIRLVERPITLVATRRSADPQLENGLEFTAVDGNCRLSSAFDRLAFPKSILPARLQDKRAMRAVLPSTLMHMSFAERRKFTRDLVKWYSSELATSSSMGKRNAAAMALNALTVPAEIIVGYSDDRYDHQQRFSSAVRGLLLRMNVSVKPFDEGAKNAVIAEEIAVGLKEAGEVSSEQMQILIGRTDVNSSMTDLGLNPSFADLRAAVVVRELTRNQPNRNAVLRAKMNVPSIFLKHRTGPVVELALRGYTNSLRDPKAPRPTDQLTRVRQALSSTPLWQNLINLPWEVVNIDTDKKVDALVESALGSGDENAADSRLLGVLGLFALTTTGHLLAPGGSAETQAKAKVDRSPIGSIVEKLLSEQWGVRLLGDAIKRARAGERLRWWDKDAGELVEFDEPKSMFNARLRQRIHEGAQPVVEDTPEGMQAAAADVVYQAVAEVRDSTRYLIQIRKELHITERLPHADVQGSLDVLAAVRDNLAAIAAPQEI